MAGAPGAPSIGPGLPSPEEVAAANGLISRAFGRASRDGDSIATYLEHLRVDLGEAELGLGIALDPGPGSQIGYRGFPRLTPGRWQAEINAYQAEIRRIEGLLARFIPGFANHPIGRFPRFAPPSLPGGGSPPGGDPPAPGEPPVSPGGTGSSGGGLSEGTVEELIGLGAAAAVAGAIAGAPSVGGGLVSGTGAAALAPTVIPVAVALAGSALAVPALVNQQLAQNEWNNPSSPVHQGLNPPRPVPSHPGLPTSVAPPGGQITVVNPQGQTITQGPRGPADPPVVAPPPAPPRSINPLANPGSQSTPPTGPTGSHDPTPGPAGNTEYYDRRPPVRIATPTGRVQPPSKSPRGPSGHHRDDPEGMTTCELPEIPPASEPGLLDLLLGVIDNTANIPELGRGAGDDIDQLARSLDNDLTIMANARRLNRALSEQERARYQADLARYRAALQQQAARQVIIQRPAHTRPQQGHGH